MTPDELSAFVQLLCGPARAGHDEGFYPQIATRPLVLKVWQQTLRAYPFERACKAITAAYKADPRHEPAVDAVVEAIKSQAPPVFQPPAWHHRLDGSLRDVIAAARPVHEDLHLARCYQQLVEQDLVVTGKEAAFIAACQQFAQQYPADATHWQAQIARKQTEMAARGATPPRASPPPQVGTFTHVSAPTRRRTPHAND